MKLKGVVLYDGPSVLDDQPIVAIATFRSRNAKTGPMVQTWIMHKNLSPLTASATGADVAVCGNCPRRHYLNGDCYVVLAHGPQKVWNAYKGGRYEPYVAGVHTRHFVGSRFRIGSYGDPAAVPFEIWAPFVSLAETHTGYTHQFRHPRFDRRIADICMVSADTVEEAARHQRRGYSTFRVRAPGEALQPNEMECRYVSDNVQCIDCGLCSGKGAANISTTAHGIRSRVRERDIIYSQRAS
jgi:hypothetical protein